ncbi:hypothetical protein D3C85_1300380 [compost metagenome]
MQPFITKALLSSVGISLDASEEEKLLAHLNETLEERVGVEITDSLDDAQLEELVTLQENGDDEATQAWMTTNVPELNEIVKDEIDILLSEIAENTEGLNSQN